MSHYHTVSMIWLTSEKIDWGFRWWSWWIGGWRQVQIHPLSHSSLLKFAIKYVSRGRLQVCIILAQEASPHYPTTVHPSGYCGNLKKHQHWVCHSLLFVFMISELRCSLSGSVSMEQEDVDAAKEFETLCVFFYIYMTTTLLTLLWKTQKAKEDSPNCYGGQS